MKIDPHTSELYTDTGKFLKTLRCPLPMKWETMTPVEQRWRTCGECSRSVHDTSILSDDDLVALLQTDPHACLMVSPTQSNCTVLPSELRIQHISVND
jgi:hypothetical protein